MHAHPGAFTTPHLGATLPISEINEALTGEERLTHERHRSLDTRLVLR
jgi:hypothetical protein